MIPRPGGGGRNVNPGKADEVFAEDGGVGAWPGASEQVQAMHQRQRVRPQPQAAPPAQASHPRFFLLDLFLLPSAFSRPHCLKKKGTPPSKH